MSVSEPIIVVETQKTISTGKCPGTNAWFIKTTDLCLVEQFPARFHATMTAEVIQQGAEGRLSCAPVQDEGQPPSRRQPTMNLPIVYRWKDLPRVFLSRPTLLSWTNPVIFKRARLASKQAEAQST